MGKLITVLLAISATSFGQATQTQCLVQPFCSRLGDCCDAHSECYSTCCGVGGQCIEPKFCYSALKVDSNLIGAPLAKLPTAAVNSTSVPYSPNPSGLTPCFTYSYLNGFG